MQMENQPPKEPHWSEVKFWKIQDGGRPSSLNSIQKLIWTSIKILSGIVMDNQQPITAQ